ncbi:interleukin 21 receptor, tandem duplicate 1 isoform 2-T3 [Pholidichthys leucotaenia]
MTPKVAFLLLLWGLQLCCHGVASACNATCTTDYKEVLNCSCSGSAPSFPVLLNVTCRDYLETVSSSCLVSFPQSWCLMHVTKLDDVAAVGTMCSVTASREDHRLISKSSFDISTVVMLQPPFDVQVAITDKFYNITWHNANNPEDCVMYTVHIRDSGDLLKAPLHSLHVSKTYFVLDHNRLQPFTNHTVDIQAKFCPKNVYHGPPSEWSAPARWTTTGNKARASWPTAQTTVTAASGSFSHVPFLVTFAIIVTAVAALILFWQKTGFRRTVKLLTDIPRPDEYFKPLYSDHQGDFKDWVKPVFSENDYLTTASNADRRGEKQLDVLHWKSEKPGFSDDGVAEQGQRLLHVPYFLSLPLQFQDSSSSGGHSTGHVSIHTVTLSGEEFEEEATSQSSLSSFEDGERIGYDLEENWIAVAPLEERQILNDVNFEPHPQFNELERISLESFAWNGQSEDGYPNVDLDTIDSGYGECSSPPALNTAERIDSDLFQGHKNPTSNYVKQWMIHSTEQEDASSSERELQETQ